MASFRQRELQTIVGSRVPEMTILMMAYSTIYFHNPKKVRADEWMFAEMESPWSGDGRGVVTQRIFSADGTLLATCFQEVSPRCILARPLTNTCLGCGTAKAEARAETIDSVQRKRLVIVERLGDE